MYSFIVLFTSCVNIYTIALISANRWLILADTGGLKTKRIQCKITNFNAVLLCVFFLAVSFCISILPVFGVSSYVLDSTKTSCCLNLKSKSKESHVYIFTMIVVLIFVPGSIIFSTNWISYSKVSISYIFVILFYLNNHMKTLINI